MGDQIPKIDLTAPEIQDAIKAAVDKETLGLKSNRDALRSEKKILEENMAAYKDVDIEALKKLAAKTSTDEEIKLFREGGLDEIVAQRTQNMQTQHQSRVDEISKQLLESTNLADNLSSQINKDKIASMISQAYIASKGDVRSTKFIVQEAMGTYSFNKDGKMQALDSDNNPIFSGDGKSMLSAAEFVAKLQTEYPSFWPGSQSAGLNGGAGSGVDLAGLAATSQEAYEKHRKATRKTKGGY